MNKKGKQLFTKAANKLVGKKVKEVRYLTDSERNMHYWTEKPIVIFFEDGTYIYPSNDPEGNEAGTLFTSIKGAEIIPSI